MRRNLIIGQTKRPHRVNGNGETAHQESIVTATGRTKDAGLARPAKRMQGRIVKNVTAMWTRVQLRELLQM